MNNFIQPGNVLTMTAGSGGVTSGSVVVVGKLVGIAATSAAENAEYELQLGGVFELAKTVTDVFAAGADVYVDSSGDIQTSASGNTKIGVAAAAAANGNGTVMVRLNTSF